MMNDVNLNLLNNLTNDEKKSLGILLYTVSAADMKQRITELEKEKVESILSKLEVNESSKNDIYENFTTGSNLLVKVIDSVQNIKKLNNKNIDNEILNLLNSLAAIDETDNNERAVLNVIIEEFNS